RRACAHDPERRLVGLRQTARQSSRMPALNIPSGGVDNPFGMVVSSLQLVMNAKPAPGSASTRPPRGLEPCLGTQPRKALLLPFVGHRVALQPLAGREVRLEDVQLLGFPPGGVVLARRARAGPRP